MPKTVADSGGIGGGGGGGGEGKCTPFGGE